MGSFALASDCKHWLVHLTGQQTLKWPPLNCRWAEFKPKAQQHSHGQLGQRHSLHSALEEQVQNHCNPLARTENIWQAAVWEVEQWVQSVWVFGRGTRMCTRPINQWQVGCDWTSWRLWSAWFEKHFIKEQSDQRQMTVTHSISLVLLQRNERGGGGVGVAKLMCLISCSEKKTNASCFFAACGPHDP